MTDQQIKTQIEAIEQVTSKTLAGGPKACKQFLINAGIIPAIEAKLRQGKVKNRYAAKGKIKQIKKEKVWFDFLAK